MSEYREMIIKCTNAMLANDIEAEIRADERAKAEQDFQNSDYWNDYLSKVLADERAMAIDECIAEINRLNLEIAYPHTICNILEQLKEQNNDSKRIS